MCLLAVGAKQYSVVTVVVPSCGDSTPAELQDSDVEPVGQPSNLTATSAMATLPAWLERQ